MTVTNTTNFKEYQADGIATVYTIPFLLLSASDLKVYLDGTLLASSYYRLKNIGQPQAEITFISPPKGKLLLQRSVDIVRVTDYQDNGDLLASTINNDFDRIYMLMQGLDQDNNQVLRVTDAEGVSALPLASERANKTLAFDNDGQPLLITSQTGSASELAQQLADSSGAQSGAALVGFGENLAYPDKTVGKALGNLTDRCDDLEKSGIPLFTTFWWPNRDSIPNGFVTADGQELPMLTYLDAANAIANGIVPTTTNDDWINNPIKRGFYVAVSRSGYFRMPDYNGKFADSIAPLFMRGGNSSLIDGTIQKDALQNITASNIARVPNEINVTGAAYRGIVDGNTGAPGAGGNWVNFDASRVARTATETRPINITGCWIVRLFGAVTEIGKADAQQLATDYANLAGRVSLIEGDKNTKKFIIFYPLGGTAATPAYITQNNRYVVDNPFPKSAVICELEIFVNGVWGTVGWIDNWGASANHVIESDKIIIQTGVSGIALASSRVGGSLGLVSPNVTTAPCRIKVWRF